MNFRISAYLQSAYPEATWQWLEEFPEKIAAKGGTGRIRLYGVPDFDYADVTGFLHWSCSNYGGDHTEWIDNLVATVETSSEDAKEYVDLKTWGVDQFNAAVVGDAGDNLSTSDTNLS